MSRSVIARRQIVIAVAAILGLGALLGWNFFRRASPPLLFLAGLTARAMGDVIVEDWSCPVAASISNSNPAIVTCSTPHNLPKSTVSNQPWIFRLDGATDDWAKINGRHTVEILDESRFSIPVDTSGFAPFENQTVGLFRGNHIGMDLTRAFAGNHDSPVKMLPEGLFEVQINKGFTTTAELLYCRPNPISSFTVSDSVAEIVLVRPLPNEPPAYIAAQGREIHFRYFADARLNSDKWRGTQFEDKPHYISEINSERTRIKVPVKVEDGRTYGPAGAPQPMVMMCPPRSFSVLFFPRQERVFPFPAGRVSNYVKTPPLEGNVNRMTMWYRFGKFVPRNTRGGYMATIGTYAKTPDDPDDRAERYHFYHFINPNFYPGRWMKVVINETPQHHRSATGTASFPNRPMIHGWPHFSSPPWDGRQGEYFSNMTMFYTDTGFFAADFSDQLVQLGPITMSHTANEPDAFVSSITAVWAPERAGNRGPGYEIGFNAPKYSTDTYEIRYSTESSLKKIGFSRGESGGANLRGLNDAATNLMWFSQSMPEQPNLWVGIRPRMSVLGISGAGSPMVITLRAQPLLANGDLVTVSTNRGSAETVPVTIRQPVFWQLGGSLVEIAVLDKIATVKLTEEHKLVPGQVVEISGSLNARLGRFPNVKTYTVITTPTPHTFTIQTPDVEDGVVNTNASRLEILSVRVFPSLSVPQEGTGTVECPGRSLCPVAGTLVSTDDFKHFTEVHLAPFGNPEPVAAASKSSGKALSAGTRRK